MASVVAAVLHGGVRDDHDAVEVTIPHIAGHRSIISRPGVVQGKAEGRQGQGQGQGDCSLQRDRALKDAQLVWTFQQTQICTFVQHGRTTGLSLRSVVKHSVARLTLTYKYMYMGITKALTPENIGISANVPDPFSVRANVAENIGVSANMEVKIVPNIEIRSIKLSVYDFGVPLRCSKLFYIFCRVSN